LIRRLSGQHQAAGDLFLRDLVSAVGAKLTANGGADSPLGTPFGSVSTRFIAIPPPVMFPPHTYTKLLFRVVLGDLLLFSFASLERYFYF
jgi:hypothetical protein